MQVTVSLWYVIGCEVCAAEIEWVTRAAIRDIQVTKLNLAPGHKHNHEPDALPSSGTSAVELEAAGQQVIPGMVVDAGSTGYAEGR